MSIDTMMFQIKPGDQEKCEFEHQENLLSNFIAIFSIWFPVGGISPQIVLSKVFQK